VKVLLRKYNWREELWHREHGPLAKLLCFLGLHDWRSYTAPFVACNRYMKLKEVKSG
jgi:hypothetical protein